MHATAVCSVRETAVDVESSQVRTMQTEYAFTSKEEPLPVPYAAYGNNFTSKV